MASDVMSGRVCVVTGATSGIGKETARELARMGATVVVHARSEDKAREAAREIAASTGSGRLEVAAGDFGSLADVRRLAADLAARFPKIHVLVNNAGAIVTERRVTRDGFELMFGTNHLAPFLLTNLLRDRLAAAAPARVVTVTSMAMQLGRVDLADLQAERSFGVPKTYGVSKHANMLFTLALARRLEGTGVAANAVHPGVVRTNLGVGQKGFVNFLFTLARPFMATPAKGAASSIRAATDPTYGEVSGRLVGPKGEIALAPELLDPELAEQLWRESEKLTGLAAARPR